MKTLVASVLSLLLGWVIGGYVERRHAKGDNAEMIQQMVQGTESCDGERAARAALAIQLIESGQAPKAVELLSNPIAHYYSLYAHDPGNEQRTRLRALIDELAKTNHVVAAQIASSTTSLRNVP